jgi:hypothetical protein
MKPLLILVSLASLLSACNGSQSLSNPTAPDSPRPTVAAPGVASAMTFTISGVVFELTAAGRAPLDNVDLYCDSCGEIGVGHTFTRTDTNGYYTFVGVFAGSNPIQVSKAGYRDPTGAPMGAGSPQWFMRQVTVVGDTRLDIELVRK